MNVLLKSIKFSGYKAFSEEVTIDFETNKNKYNFKDSVRELTTEKGPFYYNNHIGFIGPNSSGKSTIIEVFKIYRMFLERGVIGLKGVMNSFTGSVVENSEFLTENDFISNEKPFELEVNLVSENVAITHTLKIKRDFTFFEKIETTQIKNKNLVSEEIFEKDYNDQLDFLNYANFLKTNSKQNKMILSNNLSSDKIYEIEKILSSFIQNIFWIDSNTNKRIWLSDMSLFLTRNSNNDQVIKEIQDFIQLIVTNVDNKISKIKIEKSNENGQIFLDLYLILKNGNAVPYNSLSDGTWKIIGLFLRLYLINKKSKGTTYFMIDELDNSLHPNLTRIILKMIKENIFPNIIFMFTFHNPHVAQEIRLDSLFLISIFQEVSNWPKHLNKINHDTNERKLRLEDSFNNKYLDEVICSGPENFRAEKLFDFIETH